MLERLPPMDGQYGDFVVYHRHRSGEHCLIPVAQAGCRDLASVRSA